MNEQPFYSFGYSPSAMSSMQRRTAKVHAAFFLPELTPEMKILDCGCGPGSITMGLAEVVDRGQVIGIDIEPSQIDVAERKAAELGLHNCAFQAGSVLELPFADVTFDAVFGHTILMQFGNPGPVLREVSRVLKPGGAVGFRETDFGASLAFPRESAQVRAMATLRESILRNNGFPDIGRQLPRLLTDVGFKVERMNATYNASRSPIEMKRRCEWLRRLWDEADFVARAESEGWLSPETRRLIADGLVAETGDMSVFYATTYCDVVARKPK